jgi:type IV pilus assembly protein PilM
MKHRASTNGRTWPINTDGHAIGLDLGATSVRAAILALTMTGAGPAVTVHGVGSVPLPPGAVVNGVVNQQAAVVQALKQLWSTYGFKCSKVILGVANPQAVVRPLQIPNLSAQQRAKALPFQAREIIALPLDEVVLDYAQVGEPDAETGLLNGLLIASPRRPVLAAVEAVERAGLEVARVDLSSFGALRAIGDQQFKVQAVIDLGAHLTSIIIHRHGVPQLVRTLARGGQQVTDLLVENLGLTPEDAERAKRETGLTGQRDSGSAAVETAIRPLLAEIRSSINYFRGGNDGAALESISLTGGAAGLPGLAAALSSQNGVPVTVIDPMQHVGNRLPPGEPGTSESEMHASAVAFGLAIGAAA